MEQFDISLYAHAILEGLKQYPSSTRFHKSDLPSVFTQILFKSGLLSHSSKHSSTALSATSGKSSWFFDSACCNHMTSDPHIFSTKANNSRTPSIYTADGSMMPVTHVGTISTPSMSLSDAYLVPTLTLNLISIGQLCELGLTITFSSTGCQVQDPRTGKTIGTGRKVGRLYELINLHIPSQLSAIAQPRLFVPPIQSVMAMAVDFETEFPRTSSSYLSPEQRHQFFRKLKQVVVMVNTELVKPGVGFAKGRNFERPESSNTTCPSVREGAGVVLDENGTILTSAYLVPDNLQTILVRREVDEAFWEAKLEVKSSQHDLAIIVPKKNVGPFAFATLDTEGSFQIGKEVLSICHVGNLSYTSVVGQLACQDHRLFRDSEDDKDIAPLRSEKLDRDLKLLQINNCHGSPSASGAPVFSSSGRVIGLSSFVLNKFDFAVHLTVLERFYNSYQVSEGNERGE